MNDLFPCRRPLCFYWWGVVGQRLWMVVKRLFSSGCLLNAASLFLCEPEQDRKMLLGLVVTLRNINS